MSLFTNLFGGKPKSNKSGVFILQSGNLEELDVLPGGGSFNDITASLGYTNSEIHTVFTFDSKNIEVIGVKVFTQEPVFAVAKDNRNITLSQINSELSKINWSFEYDSNRMKEILNDAIDEKQLSFDFLNSILTLIPQSESIFYSKKLDLILHFENGTLSIYSSPDGFNSASKWLRNLNMPLFNDLYSEAIRNQGSELDAIFETNNQCDALQSIPNAIQNEYLHLHINRKGTPSFYNLWVAHYFPEIQIDDFIKMNKNRFRKISDSELAVGKFIYEFDEDGCFTDAREI